MSDIDILVITENLPRNPLERLDLISECLRLYPRVEPIIITIEEFIKKRDRDPAIIEASQKGIMLIDTLGLSGILLKIAIHRFNLNLSHIQNSIHIFNCKT